MGLEVNDSLRLQERSSTPSTPGAGLELYAKTDHHLYRLDTNALESMIPEVGSDFDVELMIWMGFG